VAQQPANPWRTTLKRRLAVAAGAFLLWAVAIEARLIYFQVFAHADLVAAARNQQSRSIDVAAKRGEILDRRGRILARSVDADTVYAVPPDIKNPGAAVAAICGALADCNARDRQVLGERLRSSKQFVHVRRQISPEQARRIADLDLEGIGFMKESRRYYPNKDLGAHILGYVGIDNLGLSGIESTYDRLIRGEQGTVLIQTDAHHRAFSRVERPPTSGASLELTIDQNLQHIAERELQAGVRWAKAAGGSAVVMDPITGEILALANYPTFNPNAYNDFNKDARRNRAIQDLYEPGSTFKIVTAGAALEEKVTTPEELVDARGGQIRFGSRVIRDTHDYGVLSLKDAIVKSSNVGAIRIGLELGAERMGAYVARFGFGRPISPDFPGESPGIVRGVAKMKDSALASVSMGYEVGVTPLQMAAAVSSVANGGELVEPRLVRAVVRGAERATVPRKVLGRTLSASTARQLTEIMEAVVTDGTGTAAQIDGYTVAGKTGTASKIVNGAYSKSEYNVSFVGFVPSQQPTVTIVVVVDSPHAAGLSRYGGTVAAPIFKRIAEAVLRHQGVPPSVDPALPVLVARRDRVFEQPTSGPMAAPSIVTVAGTSGGGDAGFPDLTGMNARDAARVLARLGMTPRLHGGGRVVRQRPTAGSPIETSDVATLWLER
jgi:cell division protein FtsI (penicillin-binding protein 3)